MMTSARSDHTRESDPPLPVDTGGGSPNDVMTEATQLDSSDLTVLQAVMSHVEPSTFGRLARTTSVRPEQLAIILDTLCAVGLLRRLNTILPSYTTRY
jgi:hypothetical protein